MLVELQGYFNNKPNSSTFNIHQKGLKIRFGIFTAKYLKKKK